ncbi:MAG TPA: hypothetical protein DD670_10310, partial [Planctomycetaceae bacterium]|nr:hypothetical protein [Planctomycetaceae bacterium]
IFNHSARVAWWEGPPLGGGQYHAECRGDTETFRAVLADFAKLDVKSKRIVLHDGIGHSFWLSPNREPGREADARIDWVFMVWNPKHWERFRTGPPEFNPTDPNDAETSPPATIDLYTGGNVRWSELQVPEGIEVVDNRLESHGFKPEDGSVAEGTVLDSTTKKPIAASIRLEQIKNGSDGRRDYSLVSRPKTDEKGRWFIKNVPLGTNRLVVEAKGYAPRVAGYFNTTNQPRWQAFPTTLSRVATVSGLVTDAAGQPLADVEVRLTDVMAMGRYDSPLGYSVKTDAQGRFHLEDVPIGTASVQVFKPGYCRPGLRPAIKTPAKDLTLEMVKSARLVVTVDFFGVTVRPESYIVNIEEEGGRAVGKWGGMAHIDTKNQHVFENVPPGVYVVQGHPNPTREDQKTDPITVELEGGKTHNVVVLAR